MWTTVALAAATIIYVPYHLGAAPRPGGGTALGITFGVAGFGLMAFAGLLGARRKFPVWRIGRAQTWMRGHLWLGILSLPLILFHSGFALGGPLSTLLMILLSLVTLSGIVGVILQHYLPALMTVEVPMETVYEEIAHVRQQLRDEADGLMEEKRLAALFKPPSLEKNTGETNSEEETKRIGLPMACDAMISFYLLDIQPFLEGGRGTRQLLGDPRQAQLRFTQFRTLSPPELHDTLNDLEEICEEARQLNRQARLHHWLHGWLLFHVPVSYALLLLSAVHAVMALRY